MSVKKAYLKKKIEDVIYDIYARTSADVVEFDAQEAPAGTVAAKLVDLTTTLGAVSDSVTALNGDGATSVDGKIAAACEDLRNEILGIAEGESLDEAYDTLKEVAEWIQGDGAAAAGIVDDVADLKSVLGTPSIEADPENEIEASAATGLIARIEALEAIQATSVTASQTNGNIVVDGSEVTVYTHPESHAATMITTDSTHRFITDAQLAAFGAAANVSVVTSVPVDADAKDLFIVVDEEPAAEPTEPEEP